MRSTHSNHRFVQFRRGDREALAYYHGLYFAPIYFYLQEATGDNTAAVRLAEGLFLALYGDRQKIRNEEQICYFLYSQGKRLFLDYLRDTGRLKEYEADLARTVGGQTTDTAVDRAEKAKADKLAALGIDARTVKQYLTQEIVFLRKSGDGCWEQFNPLNS